MMVVLFFLESALMLVGLLTLLYSLFSFVRRTGDFKAVLMFWQSRLTLNEREYHLNRLGIYIMLGGILVRFINAWLVN